MQTKTIEYQDHGTLLEGYLAYDEKFKGNRPAILIFHDWSGRNEFACKKAEKLAELGYLSFALDMYGKGKLGKTVEEKSKLMEPLVKDRALLQKRGLAAFATVKNLPNVDQTRMGAIGFCFGGLCAIDLARSGADVRGIVSFHGFLNAPENLPNEKIKASILAFHGNDDPMVKADQVAAFEKEMTAVKVDWQLHIFSNTKHAFTNPLAADPALGLIYNATAEKRSWVGMQNFFTEIFSQ